MFLPKLLIKLHEKFGISAEIEADLKKVDAIYPIKVSPYYFALIQKINDPIWKQCFPAMDELTNQKGEVDALAEEQQSPVPLLTHRYPNRVLLLISDTCRMFCRFCTRKRKIGDSWHITQTKIDAALTYISKKINIRDVILSGGDALLSPFLEYVLKRLRMVHHVRIIRLGTRLPCVDPALITEELCTMLKKYAPLYINTHFEHPSELTGESKKALNMLADHGFVVSNQNVLLKGINNNPKTLAALYNGLVEQRCRPYYLFQADYVKGTQHFTVPLADGAKIYFALQGYESGLTIPRFIVDLPQGGGKVPLSAPFYLGHDETGSYFKNFHGNEYLYPD